MEGHNATFVLTNNPTNPHFDILGLVQSVKLDGVAQAFGGTWTYVQSNTVTEIDPGTHHTIFISWDNNNNISVSNFKIKGIVLSSSPVFNNQNITLSTPVQANLTELLLWNINGNLVATLPMNLPLIAGQLTNIPGQLVDTSSVIGTQSYYEQAIITSTTSIGIVTSNIQTLNLGNFTSGNLNFNQTNTNTIPIYFIRKDLNTTDTRLSVIYPNFMSMKCNLGYVFAFTNKTYGPPLTNVPFSGINVNSSFKFHNIQNEIINVLCTDINSNQTGKYVLTQNKLPLQDQINQFRGGTFGTKGQFGAIDLVSLIGIIIAMIGFNRINETVGAFFAGTIIGVEAFFGFITIPTFIFAALIITIMVIVLSTRKTSVNF